jgi:hypothetical protein
VSLPVGSFSLHLVDSDPEAIPYHPKVGHGVAPFFNFAGIPRTRGAQQVVGHLCIKNNNSQR